MEKNWDTIRTKLDRRSWLWHSRAGRQWDDREKNNHKNEKKGDTIQVVDTPNNPSQGDE